MKKPSLLLTFIFVLLISFFFSNPAYTLSSVYLDPSEGTIGSGGKSIDIVIENQGEPIDGLEVTINYEGNISFVDFKSGNITGCQVDGEERDEEENYEEDIFLFCFITGTPYTESTGVFATLEFEPTGEGEGEITILDVLGLGVVNIQESSKYSTYESSVLPEASVFMPFSIVLGVSLLCLPLIFRRKKRLNIRKPMFRKVI